MAKQEITITTIDIVQEYLSSNGYDGLYSPGECACIHDDLAPCEGNIINCMPGHYIDVPDGSDADFFIGKKEDEK